MSRLSYSPRRPPFWSTSVRTTKDMAYTDRLPPILSHLGAAVLVDDPAAYKQPTVPQLERWSAEQQESVNTQVTYNATKVAKENQSGRAISEEALRKRKEREERKRAQAAAKAAAEGSEGGASADALFAPIEPQIQTPSARDLASSSAEGSKKSNLPYTIVIPASSSSLEWYDASDCTYSTIESARKAGVWDYPATLSERARCGVFKDLWKQGYFMGGGIKFGGEYLVYPGLIYYFP